MWEQIGTRLGHPVGIEVRERVTPRFLAVVFVAL